MTTEKIYEQLLAYINDLPEDERKAILLYVGREEYFKKPIIPLLHLSNLLIDLKNDMRKSAAKQTGNSKQLSAALKIIEQGRDYMNGKMTGAVTTEEGQYICNGHMAIRFKNPLDLPEHTGNIDPPDLKKVFADALNTYDDLPLPERSELVLHIKTEKARLKAEGLKNKIVYYKFGENMPVVNAEYLLSVMEAVPKAKAMYANKNSVIYIQGEGAEAVLLPIFQRNAA